MSSASLIEPPHVRDAHDLAAGMPAPRTAASRQLARVQPPPMQRNTAANNDVIGLFPQPGRRS